MPLIKQAIVDAKDDDIRIIEKWITKTEDRLIQSLLQRIINEIQASKPQQDDAPESLGPGGM